MLQKNLTCEGKCHRWNGYQFCSHIVALAEHVGILQEVINKYKQKQRQGNLTKIANTNMTACRGKKGIKSTEIRKGPANKKRTVISEYVTNTSDNLQEKSSSASSPADQLFHVTFLAGLVRKCYGCGQEFSQRNRTPPHDIILKTYDYRQYVSPKSKTQKRTVNMQNAYFHLNVDCVRRRYPNFELEHIIIHNEISQQLTDGHKEVLNRQNITL